MEGEDEEQPVEKAPVRDLAEKQARLRADTEAYRRRLAKRQRRV